MGVRGELALALALVERLTKELTEVRTRADREAAAADDLRGRLDRAEAERREALAELQEERRALRQMVEGITSPAPTLEPIAGRMAWRWWPWGRTS